MKKAANNNKYSISLDELVERLEKHTEQNHGTPQPDDEHDEEIFKAGYARAIEDILFLLA